MGNYKVWNPSKKYPAIGNVEDPYFYDTTIGEVGLRHFFGDHYEVYSAGTEPGGVSPFAILAMDEIGIDIQSQTSKGVRKFLSMNLDTVVTVCDSAREACPFVPARNNIHRRFEDPRATSGSDAEKIEAFRRVRQQIHLWIDEYFQPHPS